jgi:hypothetical protein
MHLVQDDDYRVVLVAASHLLQAREAREADDCRRAVSMHVTPRSDMIVLIDAFFVPAGADILTSAILSTTSLWVEMEPHTFLVYQCTVGVNSNIVL